MQILATTNTTSCHKVAHVGMWQKAFEYHSHPHPPIGCGGSGKGLSGSGGKSKFRSLPKPADPTLPTGGHPGSARPWFSATPPKCTSLGTGACNSVWRTWTRCGKGAIR